MRFRRGRIKADEAAAFARDHAASGDWYSETFANRRALPPANSTPGDYTSDRSSEGHGDCFSDRNTDLSKHSSESLEAKRTNVDGADFGVVEKRRRVVGCRRAGLQPSEDRSIAEDREVTPIQTVL